VAQWLLKVAYFDPVPNWYPLAVPRQHFLRKVFGSVVATRHGLFTACNYLGHSSVIVTEEHYAALLEKPVVDLMADVTVG